METYLIGDDILYLNFPSQQKMYDAANRFHVYYESPDMKGQLVEDHGTWSGYNFPKDFLNKFEDKDLSQQEEALLQVSHTYPHRYVIMTYENPNKNRTFIHETCHALYATNWSYRSEVRRLMARSNLDKIRSALSHYSGDVFTDEAQAYLIEWNKFRNFMSQQGDDPEQYLLLHNDLLRIYNQYAANLRKVPV